jgi:hypothetical protein
VPIAVRTGSAKTTVRDVMTKPPDGPKLPFC